MKKTLRRRSAGSAMIPVLCLIFTGSLLVFSVLNMSQYGRYTLHAHNARARSMYALEGAAARIEYLLASDRYYYNSNQRLDTFRYSEYEYDRYLPDGVEHELASAGNDVVFSLEDALGGIDLSANAWYRSIYWNIRQNLSDDTEYIDRLDELLGLYADYIDSDQSEQENGREADAWAALGMAPLPADAPFQYREEFAFFPEYRAFFPPDRFGRLRQVRLLPLSGMRTMTGNPTIYDAPDIYFRSACDLTEAELEQVKTARERIRTERVCLEDVLNNQILSKLQNSNRLRWSPSGAYTVVVRLKNGPSCQLVFSFRPAAPGGGTTGIRQYLEWRIF